MNIQDRLPPYAVPCELDPEWTQGGSHYLAFMDPGPQPWYNTGTEFTIHAVLQVGEQLFFDRRPEHLSFKEDESLSLGLLMQGAALSAYEQRGPDDVVRLWVAPRLAAFTNTLTEAQTLTKLVFGVQMWGEN